MNSEQKKTFAAQIRNVLQQIGWDAAPKKVIAQLKAKGVEVTPQQVSNEKAKGRNLSLIHQNDLTVEILKKVKQLVDEVGSFDLVRRALDELENLVGNTRR